MKKKLTIFICLFCFVMCLCSCTLHFKGEKIELDTEAKDIGLTSGTTNEGLFRLSEIDIFKNARIAKTSDPAG